MAPLTIPEAILTIGCAAHWARKQRGWSISEMAIVVGLPGPTVDAFESGAKYQTLIASFEEALELKLAHLPFVAPKRAAPAERISRIRARQQARHKLPTPKHVPPEVVPDEEGSKDRALTLGLRGESTHIFRGCNSCHDLPWRRRTIGGCVGCHEPYATEILAVDAPGCRSSAGLCGDAA